MSNDHLELNHELEHTKAVRRANIRFFVGLAGILPTIFWNLTNFFAPSIGMEYFRVVFELFPGFYSAISVLISVILICSYFWWRALIMLGLIDKANEKEIVTSAVPYTTVKETPERLLKYGSQLLRATDYLYNADAQARIFEPVYADWQLELSNVKSDKKQQFKLNLYYGSWFCWKIWQRSGFISRYSK